MTQRHVTPAPLDRWQVVDPERGEICAVTETRDEAVHRARRDLGRAGGGILVAQPDAGAGQLTETVPPASQAPRTSYGPAGGDTGTGAG